MLLTSFIIAFVIIALTSWIWVEHQNYKDAVRSRDVLAEQIRLKEQAITDLHMSLAQAGDMLNKELTKTDHKNKDLIRALAESEGAIEALNYLTRNYEALCKLVGSAEILLTQFVNDYNNDGTVNKLRLTACLDALRGAHILQETTGGEQVSFKG